MTTKTDDPLATLASLGSRLLPRSNVAALPTPRLASPEKKRKSRALPFTKAQVRRAVKGVESAGLQARRVTFSLDGSFTIDSGDGAHPIVDNRDTALATSWDDV
jgi:hypothetical protein